MTKLSKPVATIDTLKRLVTNADNKYATKDSLSTVAVSGKYSDLSGTPTSLPANGGTADKLSINAGSVTQPVYFANGVPVATTYSLGKSVPSDAKFTDTVYIHPTSGVTAGTYKSVTVNTQGHVTGGSNTTTLSGYGITDAKIANGTITLGSNTITPLTSHQSLSNYYTKGNVDTIINNLKTGLVNIVVSLPTTGENGKLYLVKTGTEDNNIYTEYVYVNNAWEKLGTQKLDLSGYLTKTDAASTYLGKTAAAVAANKLTVNAGSATTPTYFSDGKPVACTGISVATVTATTTLNIPGGKI